MFVVLSVEMIIIFHRYTILYGTSEKEEKKT